MTNSHKNIINPFLERSTLLIMTFPKTVESKDLLWGRPCAVDNVRARRKGVLGKLYEIQISPERGLRNSLKFPSYFGMEYVRPWNMGKKLLEYLISQTPSSYNYCKTSASRASCLCHLLFWPLCCAAYAASVCSCLGCRTYLSKASMQARRSSLPKSCHLQERDCHVKSWVLSKTWKPQFYQTFMCIREALAGDH